jgi:NSS family neurotransmitter:Na+ symporter
VKIFGKGFLDLFDFLTANIMLPLGGVLIAIFAGWMLSRASSVDELEMGDGWFYRLWWLLIRYIAPIAVGIVLLNAVGLLTWIRLG